MLKIFGNKEKTLWRIGNYDDTFESCAEEHLASAYNGDEQGLVALMQEHGATTKYYDIIQQTECSKEQYHAHFLNYNPDESIIISTSTFGDKESALKVLNILNKIN